MKLLVACAVASFLGVITARAIMERRVAPTTETATAPAVVRDAETAVESKAGTTVAFTRSRASPLAVSEMSQADPEGWLGPLKREDPDAATRVYAATLRAYGRFLEQAWRSHEDDGREPSACVDQESELTSVIARMRVRTTPDRLVVESSRLEAEHLPEAALDCIAAYFPKSADVLASETESVFPELDVWIEVPLPLRLRDYFADPDMSP